MDAMDYIDWDEGREDIPADDVSGCDQCLDEAEAEMEKEAREKLGGRLICVSCKTRISRWDSIYCSKVCKREFLASFPAEVA